MCWWCWENGKLFFYRIGFSGQIIPSYRWACYWILLSHMWVSHEMPTFSPKDKWSTSGEIRENLSFPRDFSPLFEWFQQLNWKMHCEIMQTTSFDIPWSHLMQKQCWTTFFRASRCEENSIDKFSPLIPSWKHNWPWHRFSLHRVFFFQFVFLATENENKFSFSFVFLPRPENYVTLCTKL